MRHISNRKRSKYFFEHNLCTRLPSRIENKTYNFRVSSDFFVLL